MDVSSTFLVTVQDVEFDGSESSQIPAITLTKVAGIWDGVSMRREQTDRPTGHGQFWSPGFLSGRAITLEGEIYSETIEDQDAMIGQIVALLADGSSGRMTVQRGERVMSAEVGRIGTPTITIDRWGLLARFQIQFWAPDPRWYGDDNDEGPGTSLLLVHRGNFPASSRLVLTGNSPSGYTIAAGGRQYIVTSGPTAGQTDEVDMSTGWLRRNGALLFGAVSRYETWQVPPGPGLLHTVTAAGGGTITMTGHTPDVFA